MGFLRDFSRENLFSSGDLELDLKTQNIIGEVVRIKN